MQVLSVHNRYQIRGGEDVSRESEETLLREHGHTVDVYEDHNDRIQELGSLNTALRTIWSQEAYRVVETKLSQSKFDIVHTQNLFPLISPSVYYAAKKYGVPVIQSLRNYRLFCLNGVFFRDGYVCEDCLGKALPLPGVVHRCYRNSFAASGVVASMLTVHRLRQTWLQKVDLFIALTEFARQKFIEGGLPAEKIVVKPNFLISDPGIGEGKGRYALLASRLSEEKGILTVLKAWQELGSKLPLKIAGEGPLDVHVKNAVRQYQGIEWLGKKSSQEVYALMKEATCFIFPSQWYETFGRVAVEAFATGTPVIASHLGAIAELVTHGRTGLLFEPGSVSSLTQQVEWLLAHPSEHQTMRQEARNEFISKYTAKQNYKLLMEIYGRAMYERSK